MISLHPAPSVQEFYDREKIRADADIFLLAFREALEYSYTLLENLQGKKILEIGCGSGEQACYFASQGAAVTAIDISSESIQSTQHLAKNKNLQLSAQIMSAESLSFQDEEFDAVYINSVLMHVQQEKVLQGCARVLRKKGTLVIIEPLRFTPSVQIYRLFSSYKKTKPRYMTLAAFKKNISHFSEFSHQEFYLFSPLFLPALYFKNALFHKLFFAVSAGDRLLISLFPFLKYLCWVSVVRYVK